MKLAVLDYYDYDDIAGARHVIEDRVKHLIPNFPHIGKKGTNSPNRPANDIMMNDIIDIFKALDSVKDQETA